MKKDMTEGREWSSILLFSLPIMGQTCCRFCTTSLTA